jgi:Kef-type K+ transport system membrane component KefB/mannitol/fructose-specific phosphotransferase system IIA component (Ntr-type)
VTEHDTLVFLLSLAALLTSARLLGELARRLGLPLVVGEISAGILLGPTVLGRIVPAAQKWLFGPGTPSKMLGGYTTTAVVLLLVVAGVEVNLGIVRKRGRSALLTSVLGIALPLAGGVLLGFLLPDSDLVHPEQRVLFALFMGVALSISALPVIAKTLLDLGLFKTDIGLLVMAAAMIDDLTGWLAFSVLLGPMQGKTADFAHVARTVAMTLGFALLCLVAGRPAMNRVLSRLEDDHHSAPRTVLSLVVLFALFGAAFTQAIGVHAVFGGFVVGITVGDSPHLKERTRAVIHEFVTTIFAPVFFASLGLRADFVQAFDARLVALVFVIATAAKVIGCTVGARAGGFAWRPAASIGFGLNARGAMEIILALLALEAGLIKMQVFVALVVMALGTSLVSGPMMKWLLRGTERDEDVGALVRRGAWVPDLRSRTWKEAIAELVATLGPRLGNREPAALRAVLDREAMAPTGLGGEVAVPHAAVQGLQRPVLGLGCSREGIDFNAPDGIPARIVFLLLMPPRAYDQEVRILAAIASAVIEPDARERLLRAHTLDEALAVVSATPLPIETRRPRRASLADI